MNIVVIIILVMVVLLVYLLGNTAENFEALPGVYDNAILTDNNGQFTLLQFPKGAIVMWHEFDEIGQLKPPPFGWALCDGTNGTPDLRGRIPRGGINNEIGGAESVNITLQTGNMPAHSHAYWTGTSASVQDSRSGCSGDVTGPGLEWGQESSVVGTAAPFNVPTVPPFYTLAYIMKIV